MLQHRHIGADAGQSFGVDVRQDDAFAVFELRHHLASGIDDGAAAPDGSRGVLPMAEIGADHIALILDRARPQ